MPATEFKSIDSLPSTRLPSFDQSKEGETAGEKADDEKTREENATEKQEKEGDAGKTEEVKLEKPKEEKKSQILLVKEPLKVNVKVQDLENPDQEKLKLAKKQLSISLMI